MSRSSPVRRNGWRRDSDAATDRRSEASRFRFHGQRLGEGVLSNMNTREGGNGWPFI
jgi:hypothetical protein